jgi:hypothetical protein
MLGVVDERNISAYTFLGYGFMLATLEGYPLR